MPQQVRFMRMLEHTESEMEEVVKRELEENPALERVDDPLPAYRYHLARPAADDASGFEPAALAEARAETLSEALQRQLSELALPERVDATARLLIGSLDPNGYFTRTLPQMAADVTMLTDGRLEPSQAELRQAYDSIRSLDPAGVGAMDLRDCLLLQLRRLPAVTPGLDVATEVVRHYFDIYGRRNFQLLASETGFTPAQLSEANSLILRLNPRPGSAFAVESDTEGASSAGVTPDFLVQTDGERITLSMANSLPELQVEQSFLPQSDADHSPAADFIRRQANDARGFIAMLKRRRDTLMAILRAITEIQSDFFRNGDDESRIRPMVLRDVAARTGLDPSTVSRATSGKWLATDFGVYPIKNFFNEKVSRDSDISSREIMAALREIVDAEDPSDPVGDDRLTAMLAERGYPVARRTVAKYRTRLGIPPARLRRTI